MKALADLKRDLKEGTAIRRVFKFGKEDNENFKIAKIQTESIKLEKEKGGFSWLDIPKASLVEYDGRYIKIFFAGERELTDKEKEVIANEPNDDKQSEIDALSDGNTMFYRERAYYKDSGYFYLFTGNSKKQQGKRLIHRKDKTLIEDESIKGEHILTYEVIQ